MCDIKIFDVRPCKADSGFLVDDGKTSILYDSGFGFTGDALAQNISQVLGNRKLDYIFLTHSHYDHALGSAYVKKRYPDAKVVAGEYASKIFAKDSAKRLMRELDRKFADKCGIGEYEDLCDSLCVDIAVCDGDEIDAGNIRFRAIHLPGHTKCSFGFYHSERKLLLSSETLGVYVGDGVVVPSYLVGYEMTISSIRKSKEFDIENILTPHFGLLDKSETKVFLSACEDCRTALSDYNVSCNNVCSVSLLDTKSLGLTIAAVLGRTYTLFMSKEL